MITLCTVKTIELGKSPASFDVELGTTIRDFFEDVLNRQFVEGQVTCNSKVLKADTVIDSDCDLYIAQMIKGNNDSIDIEFFILGGGNSFTTTVVGPATIRSVLDGLDSQTRSRLVNPDNSPAYMFSVNGTSTDINAQLPVTTSGKVRIIAAKTPKGNE
jgi:hypothetical protein